MKIIGNDGKEYRSEKECLIADKKYEQLLKDKEREEQERKSKISNRKKELSDKIEEASDKVSYYKKEYYAAKEEAKKIVDEANKQAQEIISAASKKVQEATNEKLNAISKFNEEFGPYKTILTGDDALDEYTDLLKYLDDEFNRFLPNFFGRIKF